MIVSNYVVQVNFAEALYTISVRASSPYIALALAVENSAFKKEISSVTVSGFYNSSNFDEIRVQESKSKDVFEDRTAIGKGLEKAFEEALMSDDFSPDDIASDFPELM